MRCLLALLAPCLIACGPTASDGGVPTDGSLVSSDGNNPDGGVIDAAGTDAGRPEGGIPRIDASPGDAGTWSEDAGVSYQSYLDCLQTPPITLASCFADAQGRAALAGPPQLSFARAVASVDADGAVPEDRAGLTYHFCQPVQEFYDCLVVDYWWSGVTAQINLTRIHHTRDAAGRQRDLLQPPDSPEIMQAFLAVSGCDLGGQGHASVSVFRREGLDRVQVISSSDSLLLSDPDLVTVENLCVP